MPIPTLTQAHELMRHHWDDKRYPQLVYVETTNFCNARCTFCLYDRMERPVEFMKLRTFEAVADKVKAGGRTIGAMFCFGEPLADADLFNKIRYARGIGVMPAYLGLNTNGSLLLPSKFADILDTCDNLTISLMNTGDEFERMTGLNWSECYDNALNFIAYRNAHKPTFKIEIGCNDVTGHNRDKVREAFAGQRVAWARDAQINWGAKVITGVIDRSIMYHSWTCDGYKGAMQVKPNGDCCFCAYDVVRNETRFANILTDDWPTIEANFKARWREPSSLCLRCDFWWNYKQMVAGGWKRGPHIDHTWQDAYNGTIADFWKRQHADGAIRYLTGSSLSRVAGFLQAGQYIKPGARVLNVGVGNGRCTRELHGATGNVAVLDIDAAAVARVADVAVGAFTTPTELPPGAFDLCICHLVVQHMADVDLYPLLRHALRSLKPGGVMAVQYAAPPNPAEVYDEGLERQQSGLVRRTPAHFERMVEACGGTVKYRVPARHHDSQTATDDNVWHGCHIMQAGRNDT